MISLDVVKCNELPEVFKNHDPRIEAYAAVDQDNEVVCYFGLIYIDQAAILHAEFLKWNYGIAKAVKRGWPKVIEICKAAGCNYILATNEDTEDSRWPKLLRLLGFPEPKLVLSSVLAI